MRYPKVPSWGMLTVAAVGLVLAWGASSRRKEGLTFTGMVVFIVFGVGAIFTAPVPKRAAINDQRGIQPHRHDGVVLGLYIDRHGYCHGDLLPVGSGV